MILAGRRMGFTLLEVLVAASVIMIALLGIAAMGANALRKSNLPDDVEKASLLAAERIDYFRAQRNPYLAVGGTYHAPPAARYIPDLNVPPDGDNVNTVVNGDCTLFVREYLYETSEKHYSGELGREDQADRFDGGVNMIAATPVSTNSLPVSAVMPNPLGVENAPVLPGSMPTVGGYSDAFQAVKAPRANESLKGDGTVLPDNVRYVREVWIQTNHPGYRSASNRLFSNIALPDLLNTYSIDDAYKPAILPNLPPFAVAVTVRVFARDRQTRTIGRVTAASLIRNPATTTEKANGPGYDRAHPLSSVMAIFALKRKLGS